MVHFFKVDKDKMENYEIAMKDYFQKELKVGLIVDVNIIGSLGGSSPAQVIFRELLII